MAVEWVVKVNLVDQLFLYPKTKTINNQHRPRRRFHNATILLSGPPLSNNYIFSSTMAHASTAVEAPMDAPNGSVLIDTQHEDLVHDAQLDYYGCKLATCSSGASDNEVER